MGAKKVIPHGTVERVIRRVKGRQSLKAALAAEGLSYALWRRETKGTDVGVPIKRGRVALTYTAERVQEVQRRLEQGEFLRDVCADMAMDPSNLSRWCRRRGIVLFSPEARRRNHAQRDYSNTGPSTLARRRELTKKIASLAGRGLTGREMARRAGCTRETARRYLRRLAAEA